MLLAGLYKVTEPTGKAAFLSHTVEVCILLLLYKPKNFKTPISGQIVEFLKSFERYGKAELKQFFHLLLTMSKHISDTKLLIVLYS